MKILLISDTHGNISPMFQLALGNKCDAIIHAGDFGFYDNESINRLSAHEIKLIIQHSEIDRRTKDEICQLSSDKQKDFIQEKSLMGELAVMLESGKPFDIPVYAVWGNHEDVEVVRRFVNKKYEIKNLFLINENNSYHLAPFHIMGIGGNFILNDKLWQNPIAGGNGTIWSVFKQYQQLMENIAKQSKQNEKRIFVSHVSPGKVPIITLIAACCKADYTVSGHMGHPVPMVWTEFAIREHSESETRIKYYLTEIENLYKTQGDKLQQRLNSVMKSFYQMAYDTLNEPDKYGYSWPRDIFNINLPDYDRGYAIINTENENQTVSTFGSLR